MQQEDGGNWAREPHLSPEQLNSVRGLNQRFLELAGRGTNAWDAAQLAPLSDPQRAALANCPYALFDLRFEDENYWKLRLSQPPQLHVADGHVSDEVTEFVRLALFYAWHVSCTARLAAQFLLGMSPSTVEAFRSLSVNRLPALTATEVPNLSARWPQSPAYWSGVIDAVVRADFIALRRAQLYGLQLAAAARLP